MVGKSRRPGKCRERNLKKRADGRESRTTACMLHSPRETDAGIRPSTCSLAANVAFCPFSTELQ